MEKPRFSSSPGRSRTKLGWLGVLVVLLGLVVGPAVAPALATDITPIPIPGASNQSCGDLLTYLKQNSLTTETASWSEGDVSASGGSIADGYYTVPAGSFSSTQPVSGLWVEITNFLPSNSPTAGSFDWSSNFPVDAVYVKTGVAGGNLYLYDPNDKTSDTGLQSPTGQGNGFSHLAFCYDGTVNYTPNTTVTITPSATSVTSGGSVTYTVSEQNTGNVALTNPSVVLSGGLTQTLSAEPNSGDTNNNGILDIGETWTWTGISSGTLTSDQTVTATGHGTYGETDITAPTYPKEQASAIVTVTHTNVVYGYFTVSKALAGDLNGWAGATFTFTVNCGGTSQNVSLTVGADGKTVTSPVFTYLPSTVCSVTEGALPDAGTDANWINSPKYSAASVTIAAGATANITVTNTRSYTPPTPKPTKSPSGAVAGATGTPSLPPTTSLPGQGGGPNGIILLLLGALGAASMVLITTTQLRKRLLDSIDQ